ncbi:BRCT domain-containing protein [Hymenobacter sp. BT635]|uniref:BRCT domain-containing protein n=1 Tax=Hymenobacter nitidus TaxID=2880929 RepID=A0ABS8AJ84_9BACT|nr:BRCT domain-containing protein [Hymenobacter nitidus]MCB2380490.1 BRCT domain-containing protein [Hymenobacter nitidus]
MSTYPNPLDLHGQPLQLFNRANNTAKAVDQLVGICTGILADGEVSEREAIFFAEWVRKHAADTPVWPLTAVLSRVERIFEDGVCDAEERAELQEVMETLCGFMQAPTPQAETLSTALPLCVPQPHPLVFSDKQVVVTGKFAYGARTAVFEAIDALGGQPTDSSPTRATDYLVIGVFASRDWINTSHGRKIEKAVQLRDKGTGIRILSEEHWRQFVK